jgi:hypothetical protein
MLCEATYAYSTGKNDAKAIFVVHENYFIEKEKNSTTEDLVAE